ncbi:MAG TPA: hypothetical protein PK177_01060 [Burkholderiaceae bacterium]|nr:hypothetical protein [Burkholderiaceae bacterium]
MTTGSRSRLLINPDYVAAHCRSDDHLEMLVLHELYHVLLGHTRLYRRVKLAQNWAFDCLINAQLCRLFPHPRHTGFFVRLTADATGPALLLGPPAGWRPGGRELSGHAPSPRYGEGARALRLHDAHWRLYAEESVTTEELYALLERIGRRDGELTGLPLLGDHGAEHAEELDGAVVLVIWTVWLRVGPASRSLSRSDIGDRWRTAGKPNTAGNTSSRLPEFGAGCGRSGSSSD